MSQELSGVQAAHFHNIANVVHHVHISDAGTSGKDAKAALHLRPAAQAKMQLPR